MAALPDNLQIIYENMNPFQKKYCEYRSKGLSQSNAAQKAGSEAQGKNNLGRVGFNVEAAPGHREYIAHLQQTRAKVAMIDNIELIDKLRNVYDGAMTNEKFKDALGSIELMGKMIGLFGSAVVGAKGNVVELPTSDLNDVSAFKEEDLNPNETAAKLEQLQLMMREINK
jgi:hypothetical protein